MKNILVIVISLLLFTSLAFPENSGTDTEFEPKYYDNAKVLRVKFAEGESFVKRSYEDGFEETAINLPIFEKDLAGTTNGHLEVYMGRLNYLRLDQDSEVVFEKIPELRKTSLTLRVVKGGIYIDVENLDFERDIEIQTPDCGIFLLDKGLYRVNVTEGGRTEVFVFDGIAEVAGEDYTRNVRENQKIVMLNGSVKERPYYFYSSDTDDFDRWSRNRNQNEGAERYSSSRYLDEGYEDYEYELTRSGRWSYNSTYGSYVWVPYNVGADWRPYYRGRWIYNPYYGNVWSSYDTWGFFTHHYGRWHWDPLLHWHWIPGYHWSPAWVSWFQDDLYYGWCPLSWWNRPVIVYNGHWWRHHDYRHGIPRYARSTTVIKKSMLQAPRIHNVALKKAALTKMGKQGFAFKGKGPDIKPKYDKVTVINAKGKAMLFKKNALVSNNKYKQFKDDLKAQKPIKSGGDKENLGVFKYTGKSSVQDKLSKYSKSENDNGVKNGNTKTVKYKPYKSEGLSTQAPPKRYMPYNDNPTDPGRYPRRPVYIRKSGKDGTTTVSVPPRTDKSYTPTKKSDSSGSSYTPTKKSTGAKGVIKSKPSTPPPPKKKKDSPTYSYGSYTSQSSGDSTYKSYSYPSDSTKKSYRYYAPSTRSKTPVSSSYSGSSRYQSSSKSSSSGSSSAYGSSSRSSSSRSSSPRSGSGSSYRSAPRSSSGSSARSSSGRSSSRSSSGRSSSGRSSSGKSSSGSSSSPKKK